MISVRPRHGTHNVPFDTKLALEVIARLEDYYLKHGLKLPKGVGLKFNLGPCRAAHAADGSNTFSFAFGRTPLPFFRASMRWAFTAAASRFWAADSTRSRASRMPR